MDLSLNDSQQMLIDTFSAMLAAECPTTHVRDCEDSGFSAALWDHYCALGANLMALPEEAGGLDMGLLELGLVATQSGRALAPVPFIEIATVGRLLTRVAPDDPLLNAIAAGRPAVSLAIPRPHAVRAATSNMVPFGAVVDSAVALRGGALAVVDASDAWRSHRLRDLGSGALAYWDVDHSSNARVIATGEPEANAMRRAADEWKLLAAFWLTGIAKRALEIGATYAVERVQFGRPIGGFQAIAHPLAECAMRVDGAELLCWEAAWADGEAPHRFAMLSSMAFAWAARTALRTTDVSLHTHGGYGFSTEYDIQLYFRRARALSSIGGGAREELQAIAERCFDADGSGNARALIGGS